MRTPVIVLTVLALAAGVSSGAMAAPGDPDPSTSATPSTSTSPTTTPSPSATPGPYGIAMGQNIREDAWCRLLVPNKKGDAAEADSIMEDGIVDLGQYGYYTLGANPNWKPQKTLDGSGNTHVNGLHWTVPLLYTGARRDDPAMVDKFFGLIGDWLAKHRKKKTRTWSVTQPIIAGERLWTLTCASDISNGAKFVKATRKEANTQIRTFKIGSGTNNTGIHSQGSALAAFCYLGDTEQRDRAAANLDRLADYLILKDGSDREGSPWYAYYTLRLLENLAPIYDRCGVPYDRIYAATNRLQHFLAAAVDPNFHLVMTGDTHRATLAPKWFAPDSEARWAATKGVEGQPPQSLYEVFSGGYVFGRNSWTKVDGHHPTFYSVRVSRPYVTAHVHSDLGAVTFNSYGTEFVGDPGPYRYDSSAIRDYMVSRSGHSVIRVTEKPKKKPKKKASTGALGLPLVASQAASTGSTVLAATEGPYDRTCLQDRTYLSARITRCVYYDTAIDSLVVVDTIKARKRIRADQRWQVPNGVRVTTSAKGAVLVSPTAQARMVFRGGGTVRTYRPSGSRADGWFTNGYGELVKGTTLQRRGIIGKGKKRTWISVLAAGETAPAVSLTDGVVAVTREKTTTFPLP